MAKELPINPRIVEIIAKGTIRTLPEAIIELVTNCDDSYKRLETNGQRTCGEIEIYANRKKGGVCEALRVKDFAEGMPKEKLEKAIEFSGETSEFGEGRSVRGLFGRGLKEAIIALGKGKIETVWEGKINAVRIWWDKGSKRAFYEFEKENDNTHEKNGTCVYIEITNKNIKIPELKTFAEQISKHYALRDINNSSNRKVVLIFDDLRRKLKETKEIKFTYPEGKKIFEGEVGLPSYGDRVKLVIKESPKPLDSPRSNPYGLAGILIKTKGATLDNQLFKFDTDPTACYFFGEAICDDLEERLQKGETEILDPNRGGLEWKHEYCQALSTEIEKVLEPFILEKKRLLEKKPEKEVAESTKKMLKKLCSILNEFAKKELEETNGPPPEPEPTIDSLSIKPEKANIQLNKPRTFSIYAPDAIVRTEGQKARIKSSNLDDIHPLASEVVLERHKEHPQIWYRYFKVVGRKEGAEGTVEAGLGTETAKTEVKVGPLGHKPKPKKLTGGRGAFISDVLPDELLDPPQRVMYDKGIVRIYINFPSVESFIKPGLKGAEEPEGKILLAELVGEAFCKRLASDGIEKGKYPKVPGGEIDSFNTAVNELQKKYLHKIQKVISEWKFS